MDIRLLKGFYTKNRKELNNEGDFIKIGQIFTDMNMDKTKKSLQSLSDL
jgi:hypothetical protein